MNVKLVKAFNLFKLFSCLRFLNNCFYPSWTLKFAGSFNTSLSSILKVPLLSIFLFEKCLLGIKADMNYKKIHNHFAKMQRRIKNEDVTIVPIFLKYFTANEFLDKSQFSRVHSKNFLLKLESYISSGISTNTNTEKKRSKKMGHNELLE